MRADDVRITTPDALHVRSHRLTRPRRRSTPLWLPWLAAPAFMLLPIGGCGLAETWVQGDRPPLSAVRSPGGSAAAHDRGAPHREQAAGVTPWHIASVPPRD